MVQPAHARIADALRGQIRRGALAPGDALPSEAQLGAEHAASRGTVRHALAALRAEGLIAGGRGKPPVVRRSELAQSFDELVSFSAWAESLGRHPGARTIELARRRVDDDVAARLGLAPNTLAFELVRVRLLDDSPIMVERTTFPEGVGQLLLDADLDGGSIYAQLASRGVRFAEAHQTIAAIAAGKHDARLLAIAPRSPLLEVRRLTLSPDGEALEWSLDRYRGDAFAITLHADADPRAGMALGARAGAA